MRGSLRRCSTEMNCYARHSLTPEVALRLLRAMTNPALVDCIGAFNLRHESRYRTLGLNAQPKPRRKWRGERIAALEAERDALAKDAERYWSKKHIDYLKYVRALGRDPADDEVIAWNMSYDAAIDAAREKP